MLTLQKIAFLFILKTFILIETSDAEGCGPKFHPNCYCGYTIYSEIRQYVVNCTDIGYRNTSVLEFIPEHTEVLIFTGNYLLELPWNIFGSIHNYSLLNTIDMSNNHIHEIHGKTYHHVANVKLLMLNHNNLSISRYDDYDDNGDEINHHHPRVFSNFINLESLHLTNAFMDNTSDELSENLHDIFINSNLTKLMKLHLEQNEIKKFKDKRVFCDLLNLRDLHLGDNYLNEIEFNVTCMRNLRFLDLERNKFENVKMSDFKKLDKLQNKPNRTVQLIVDFSLNPFVCDCKLNEFHLWLKNTNVTVRNQDNLMCYRNKVKAEPIINMKLEKCTENSGRNMELIKKYQNRHSEGYTVTLVFLLVVLIFALFGLVSTLLYMNREKIKFYITPVLDTISKKVQYTTIKDEEIPEVHV